MNPYKYRPSLWSALKRTIALRTNVVTCSCLYQPFCAHKCAQGMPKLRSGEEWAKGLRQDIKTEIGLGWNVCGHKRSDGTLSGSCKLTHRTEDGRRSSVMLPFPWEASSKRQILNRVIAIAKALQADPQKELNEVAKINAETVDEQSDHSGLGLTKSKGWDAVLEKFLKSKSSCRWKTLRDYDYRLGRALELLNNHICTELVLAMRF